MRAIIAWLCFACTACAYAERNEPPEVLRARQKLRHVRSLVHAGALPAAKLKEAQQRLEEAQDEAILHQTLYGSVSVEDLTEQQADQVVAAAQRRLRRHAAKVERTQQLIEAGAAPRLSLPPLLEEGDRRQKVFDLALSRARLLRELAAMAQAEKALQAKLKYAPQQAVELAERYDGHGIFRPEHLKRITLAFESQFDKPLPISAHGDTAVHRALGFDHRGRVDVALDPDQPEGIWLRHLLQDSGIPYFAYRGLVPGQSTAPHIHIGPPSGRIRSGG